MSKRKRPLLESSQALAKSEKVQEALQVLVHIYLPGLGAWNDIEEDLYTTDTEAMIHALTTMLLKTCRLKGYAPKQVLEYVKIRLEDNGD
jgi:hypothetical protein